jgi:glycosyltransferase involved in cell wall biosynthesis
MEEHATYSAAPPGGCETGSGDGSDYASVLVASILRPAGATGVQTHVSELQHYLRECSVPSALVTPFSAQPRLAATVFSGRFGIEALSTSGGVLWYRHWHKVFLANALRRQLKGTGPAVVYAQGPEAAQAALEARSGADQRVVMAVHFLTSQADGWAVKGRIRAGGLAFRHIRRTERDVIPYVDGLVYVSEAAREHVLSWLPEAGKVPSTVVHNFVRPLPDEGAVAPRGDLVSVGALDLAKNQRFLIEVVAAARDRGRELTLDVFGEGPCRRQLVSLAGRLGVGHLVRLLGRRSDVRKLLPGYQVYVHASRTETGPIAIIEAMAAGLPVVARHLESVKELFDDEVEGRIWPNEDAEAAAGILLDLLDSPSAMAQARAAARARYLRDFQSSVLVPRLAAFLLGRTGVTASAPLSGYGPAVPGARGVA